MVRVNCKQALGKMKTVPEMLFCPLIFSQLTLKTVLLTTAWHSRLSFLKFQDSPVSCPVCDVTVDQRRLLNGHFHSAHNPVGIFNLQPDLLEAPQMKPYGQPCFHCHVWLTFLFLFFSMSSFDPSITSSLLLNQYVKTFKINITCFHTYFVTEGWGWQGLVYLLRLFRWDAEEATEVSFPRTSQTKRQRITLSRWILIQI